MKFFLFLALALMFLAGACSTENGRIVQMNVPVEDISVVVESVPQKPTIEIEYVPPSGMAGRAVGRVIWHDLSASNSSEYAIIAMLDDVRGGDQYVKPFYFKYLTSVDSDGLFVVNITTQPNDRDFDNFLFYLVERSAFSGKGGEYIKKRNLDGHSLAMLPIKRSEFWASVTLKIETLMTLFNAVELLGLENTTDINSPLPHFRKAMDLINDKYKKRKH